VAASIGLHSYRDHLNDQALGSKFTDYLIFGIRNKILSRNFLVSAANWDFVMAVVPQEYIHQEYCSFCHHLVHTIKFFK
jgi:hypothetical protein